METEPSSFETSEMLATFLASTPLLSESWKLCSHANTAAPLGFVANRAEDVAYVAFSSVQAISALDPSHQNLVRLDGAGDGVFSGLQRHLEGEEPVMVHAGLLQLFLYMYHRQDFQIQVSFLNKELQLNRFQFICFPSPPPKKEKNKYCPAVVSKYLSKI